MSETGQEKRRWRDSPATWIGAIASLFGVVVAIVAIVVSASNDGGPPPSTTAPGAASNRDAGAASNRDPDAPASGSRTVSLDTVELSAPGPPPEYAFAGDSSGTGALDDIRVVAWPVDDPSVWVASAAAAEDEDGRWSATLSSDVLTQPFTTRIVIVVRPRAVPASTSGRLCTPTTGGSDPGGLSCRAVASSVDEVVDPAAL